MGRKNHKTRREVKVHSKVQPPQKIKVKLPKEHKRSTLRPKIQNSKVFHVNCCKYKIRSRPMRCNQCNLATQCPSRTVALAPSVPLLHHPVRRKVVHMPETVVMHMRNMENARRVADMHRRTLIKTYVPSPDEDDDEDTHQVDRRSRQVYRRARQRPLSSDLDVNDMDLDPFQ
ncbi:uncharacterized protein LOC117137957 [Drosophila mauritiana]|uniref:Uncharacterized protein LOC117137957 n=1 Tax=Drosophila mauritiana TaxID=7226 RepID=A0A6P8JZW3_DROMA|nr:uncharacterized protein LOC117137957 [Drosophila mauritiana]